MDTFLLRKVCIVPGRKGPYIREINPLSLNTVQDQFSPYNYPYTVKR